METAFEKVKDKKKSLYVWILSNLGDMYGHAGRVEEAYKAYLDVLKKDPSNLYCLKGIAWIAWSHDNNAAEAKRVLEFILSQTEMPELRLLLAEICAAGGDEKSSQQWRDSFVKLVSAPAYGGMYNKYLIELYSNSASLAPGALPLAKAELENRFTPETNDWLAWAYYNLGETDKAWEIARYNVYKKTFEPDAVMHTAYIFAAKGKKAEAKEMLKECLESSFEIGPVAVKEIKEKIKSL
jgi:tetratricopeptide (TPR) repeat protein